MCGIIGILGHNDVASRLIDGLRRLEYRGYDSAGNAHPHATDALALVHNGIIENFKELRDELIERGRTFESETDTEVIAHLISEHIEAGEEPRIAVRKTLDRLRGAFSLAILFKSDPDLLIGARLGSPLVVGHGEGEGYLGSDAIGLAPFTQKISYLEEGDMAVVTRKDVLIYDVDDELVARPIKESGASAAMIEKGNHRHFMQKEIFEQPVVVAQTLSSYLRPLEGSIAIPNPEFDLGDFSRISIVACGTAFYVAMIGKYWIEKFARVPVEVDFASEFRYRDPILTEDQLAIVISQSGETADTLAALKHCKAAGLRTAGIINVPTSSMAREVDLMLPTHAGPEIGVASTKAFTCQLAVMAALAVNIARAHGRMPEEEEREIARHLAAVPQAMNAALNHDEDIAAMAHTIAEARDVLYLGRGPDYPMALEGALKLKEISYIHAEGYASGEMKHGPIALIDDSVPLIVIAPSGPLFEKTVSNMQEAQARGAQVVLISDAEGIAKAGEGTIATIEMPKVHPLIAPLVYAIPIQLLAYHVAVAKGTDVDQPRNLAKSVTVE
ncbi:MAG: glutamine--fructose-6-phosphate transaminase (isomerizing) [Sphingomonadales bacterium]|nr:glutamine--fructose-6-phosphate transaminase (isomerizing) [Sphingomonadales bacterium]